MDKHGKAVQDSQDTIIAGDAVIFRPLICDALGNKTVPEEGTLDISVLQPDGTFLISGATTTGAPKLILGSKGGLTTFDIRHDAIRSGTHEMHIKLGGKHIQGSPAVFIVVPAVPDVKSAKLHAPKNGPLYADTPCVIMLATFDRFGNACPSGEAVSTLI